MVSCDLPWHGGADGSNAYLSGMFNNKRIVLYDTLFPAAPPTPAPAINPEAVAEEKETTEPTPETGSPSLRQ